ncbi:MAG TPA: hypothetical protein VGC34_09725 [Steroidobacteraceae bacterium]
MLGALLAASCSTEVTVSDTVGPARPLPRGDLGQLVVYSATRVGSGPLEDPDYFVHTDYTLIDAAGAKRAVVNQEGVRGEDVRSLPLAPGRYHVRAAGSQGMVVVPVLIVAGRTTMVDLDGSVLGRTDTRTGDWVRLPDGQAIGWRPMP